ncbi:hypothetical protein COB52_02130 [Candidatus Kaiserbacteria bacterium]|nr:MAG: hypothetical protein COB52_02130 [Candidatus Kaiserbacteria bacterium]
MSRFRVEQIKEAAEIGQKDAARALSSLAKRSVNISTTEANIVDKGHITEAISDLKEDSVIVYTQTIPGSDGLSFLSLERMDALALVDLFNQREKGTTQVMTGFDYSTLTETLNILANSYVNALARMSGKDILLSVPKTANKNLIRELSQKMISQDMEAVGVLFGTDLEIEDENFSVGLFFFFLTPTSSEEEQINK